MTTGEKIIKIGGPILIVFLVIFGLGWLKHTTKIKQEQIHKESVVQTYSEDLKAQAQAKKNKKPKTSKELAEALILNKTGLGATKNGYDMTGIDSDAGVFVTQGILKGNGIPYSTNFTGYNNSTFDLSGFDADNEAYWDKIKKDDYNKLAGNAKQQVDNYRNDNQKYQTQEVTNALRKAKYDEQTKNLKERSNKSTDENKDSQENTSKNTKDSVD